MYNLYCDTQNRKRQKYKNKSNYIITSNDEEKIYNHLSKKNNKKMVIINMAVIS